MSYYDYHKLTPGEAKRANIILKKLHRENRFFLEQIYPKIYEPSFEPFYDFDSEYFQEMIEFNKRLRNYYLEAERTAEKSVLEAESRMGITPYELRGKEKIAKLSLYTGKAEISRIFPLRSFLTFKPSSEKELADVWYNDQMSGEDLDDYSLNYQKSQIESSIGWASQIYPELEKLSECLKDSVVIIINTSFPNTPRSESLYGFTSEFQLYPKGLSYLARQMSKKEKLITKDKLVFKDPNTNHVCLAYDLGNNPKIEFKNEKDNDDPISFAAVF